jgi:hypothetical protein
MDIALPFDLIRQALLVLYISQSWLAWILVLIVLLNFLYLTYFLLYSSLKRSLKIGFMLLNIPIATVIFYIPNFYASFNSGTPDKLCPTLTTTYTGLEPVQYDYLGHHLVAGPTGIGFVDFLVLNHHIFGISKDMQNGHLCRVPYDAATRKLLAKLKKARDNRAKVAKTAGVDPFQAGTIKFSLPGSMKDMANLSKFLKNSGKLKKEDGNGVDESFGKVQFKAPKVKNSVK